jgi:NADPH:quinone reductase-like Zn-dependent oxidoreductase
MEKKETMKAIICTKYGGPSVLQIEEVEKSIPNDSEVLIKVSATTATLYDSWCRSGTAPPGFKLLMRLATGIRKPKQNIIGTEFAGVVASVGKDVSLFKKGDHVFGFQEGTYSEFICLPEHGALAQKPSNLSFEQAASVPYGALTALYFLKNCNIQEEQKVLIFGASGGVGSYAVQLAKYFGAEVTGVCSTTKIEYVKSLGADKVVDYKKDDFTQTDDKYNVIFDTIGKTSVGRTEKLLKKDGYYLFTTFGLLKLIRILWMKFRSKTNVDMGELEAAAEDLVFLKDLFEKGKLITIIDKSFPMAKVSEAHAYIDSGKKQGQIVILMEEIK